MEKNTDHYNTKNSPPESGSGNSIFGKWFGKPYYAFGDYLFHKYNTRVLKLPINAYLSCPNRDGTISSSGCIFCSEDGSASPTSSGSSDITEQMNNAKRSFKRSRRGTRYIAYFQAFTNTYAAPKKLKKLYDRALSVKDVVGLMIATRPDCINNEILDLIAGYKQDNFELWLEIGMQSAHDRSLTLLNRGHTHKATRDAIERAAERDIPVCVHVILGIPDESWKEMMETADEISRLPVSGVKIHHLHVIKGTKLEKFFEEGKFSIISFEEYVSTICDFIERLRHDILIHRLIGDKDENNLIAPRWSLHKGTVIKEIESEFIRRGTCQGFLFNQI